MRPADSRSDDTVSPPSALAEGHPLAPQQLSLYLRRRLASPLAVAIKRKKWVAHRRTLGDAPTGVGARGTGFARPRTDDRDDQPLYPQRCYRGVSQRDLSHR